MRNVCLIFGLLLPASLSASVNLTPVISREADKCAAAWQREDFPAIVACMPARVVQQMGGRAALANELKGHFADVRRLGAEQLEARPGKPSTPRQVGGWVVAYVPVTAVVRSAYLDLTQDTHALALSSDRGKRWSFVLLYGLSQAELNAWFPEFGGKVVVPSSPKPRLTLAR